MTWSTWSPVTNEENSTETNFMNESATTLIGNSTPFYTSYENEKSPEQTKYFSTAAGPDVYYRKMCKQVSH